MVGLLRSWTGQVEVNETRYRDISSVSMDVSGMKDGQWSIKLLPAVQTSTSEQVSGGDRSSNLDTAEEEVRITVKRYMTKPASPGFDFMSKWNHDKPMPLCTMTGVKVKETKGMVYMKLHGDIWTEKLTVCMKCGKPLTNPVSQYFGIGPECGHHNYINPFDSDEELKEAVNAYKLRLQAVTWEGWVIKSAILKEDPVKPL